MLDFKTVMISYFTNNLLIAVLLAILWRQNRKRYDGLSLWLIASITQSFGLLLLAFRDILPDIVTIIIANTLFIGGYLVWYVGLERFVGKQRTQIHNVLILTIFVCLMSYFTYVRANISMRNIIIAAVVILMTAQCSELMLRRVDPWLKPITRYVGLIFLLYTLLAFVRIVFFCLTEISPDAGLLQLPAEFTWIVLVLLMLSFGMMFAFVMMVTGRQRLDIQRQNTERRRTEEALRESEMKYRLLVDQSLLGILIIQGGRIRYVNNMIAGKGGYSVDELMSLPPTKVIKLIHPEDRQIIWNRMLSRLSGKKEPERNECRLLARDGTIYWADVHTNVIEYLGKPAIQMCVVDITERKRAEDTLQRYNQRLMILRDIDRDIVMARSPEAIVDTVLKHIRRLVPCWRANVILYEPDTDEIVILASEANGETAVQPDMRFPAPTGWAKRMLAEHYRIVEDTHAMPEPIPPVVRMAAANGTRSFITTSLLVEGNLIGALTLGRRTPAAFAAEDIEITIEVANQLAIAIHQAQLKEQIERYSAELEKMVAQRTAQLESANKDLESFSYSVSHDLRAPLRAISGFAAIVARRHRADLNEEGQHYVDNIVLASERMGHLIDDLLQYSRLGRGGVHRERVPLREVFDPLASDLAAHLAEIGGTLSIADDLPAVMGNRTLLSQVFANLLENAITYRQPDVPVQVTVSCQAEGKDIVVCVGDNGIGIPSEYHEKIFNIFQRLHSDDEYPGTGIGLATVKKSTELLGGQVWVESVVGEGSKFFVKLAKE